MKWRVAYRLLRMDFSASVDKRFWKMGLGEVWLGTGTVEYNNPLKPGWEDDASGNIRYYCPCCGYLWGSMIVTQSTVDEEPPYFCFQPRSEESMVVTRYCARHGNGSFLWPWQESNIAEFTWPKLVLMRELFIALAAPRGSYWHATMGNPKIHDGIRGEEFRDR